MMNAAEFERTVALGLGRAVIHCQDHDSRSFREIILDACLHNKAYDPQVEGSRAVYLRDLVRATGDKAFFEETLLQSLAEEADSWDRTQRFQLASLFAQEGNPNALSAMKESFRGAITFDSDVALEFINLDGIQGLLFVADRIGESLTQNSSQWEDDYLLAAACEICGREAVNSAFEDSAKSNPNIRAYLAAVTENQALRAGNLKRNPKTLTYPEVRALIDRNEAVGILREWAQAASDSDIVLAAYDLLQEDDPTKLRLYLMLFRSRQFPLGLERLFELAELPDGPIPHHTMSVLANLQDERVRGLSFRLVETGSSMRGYAINLLVQNFRPGDHAIVEAWCDSVQDTAVVNAFDRSLQRFFAAHSDDEREARLLKKFYEKEPCAHCRYYLIERLIALNDLPETLGEECLYDSYPDTRALFRH